MSGRMLNHYEVIESLGKGGMGEVYLARDTRLNRKIALKILDPGTAGDPSRKARFEREARAIAALNHPNIVTVYSVEESGGTHFITMELIEGTNLTKLIAQRGIDLSRLLDIGIALAEALAAAHGQGITHRDLKPDNVMVTGEGRVKVLDFGLAKLVQEETGGDIAQLPTRELTQSGLLVGTVPYMSPEQIEGKPLDGRSDIFSLGIILHQMATGERPFRGDSGPALMSAILRDRPSPVTESRADLPRHLARVIQRCLEKDPEERYQSARDVRYELRNLVREVDSGDAEPAFVDPGPGAPKRRPRDKERSRIHPLVAITAIISAMIVAIVALNRCGERSDEPGGSRSAGAVPTDVVPAPTRPPGAPGVQPAEMSARPGIAVLPLANLSGDPAQEFFADGMTEALITDLAKIGGLRVISRGSVMRYKGTETPIPEIARQLGVGYLLQGSVLRAGDRVRITTQLIAADQDAHIWAENYEENLEDILSVQSRVAREVAGQVRVQLSPADEDRLASAGPVNAEAYQLYLKGRNVIDARTGVSLRRGLGYFEQAIVVDPKMALAWAGKAATLVLLGEYGEIPPNEALPLAKEAALKALELDDTLAEAHAALGEIHHYGDWDREAAAASFRRAIELTPSYATAHQWYAEVLTGMLQEEEARREIGIARELDPHSKIIRAAEILYPTYSMGRFDEAIEKAERMIEQEPDVWLGYWTLGLSLNEIGRYEEAVRALERAVELSDRHPFPLSNAAAAQAHLGNEKQAREILNELLMRVKSEYVHRTDLAVIYTALGDHDSALRKLEEGLRLRDHGLITLHVTPYFDDLKADPRYEELLAKIRAAKRS
ncbi:MAG: protein kinase [Acidobacteria bacterium]|nr:protein kinase [Acidobacteriota bacterium]